MNLANEVSAMETELASLRVEVGLLRHGKGLMEYEIESLRRELAKARTERDNYLRRAEATKVLLDMTGSNLVSGINKYHATERELLNGNGHDGLITAMEAPTLPAGDARDE